MKVEWVTVGPFQENSYLLGDGRGRGVLIDPGDEPTRIVRKRPSHGRRARPARCELARLGRPDEYGYRAPAQRVQPAERALRFGAKCSE